MFVYFPRSILENPRAFLISLLLLSLAAVSLNVMAEPTGFVSSNAADLPPSFERHTDIQSQDPNTPPAYGPKNAKVLIVVFADFQCPACRRSSQATHQIASEFPGEVRIEFMNHPLESHRNADLAANAAMAAQQQGRFWEMYDLLFANRNHEPDALEGYARELGLDIDRFRSDMKDTKLNQRLDQEISLAEDLNAIRTPSYLVNGKLLEGWASWRFFRQMVGQELSKANKLADDGMDAAEIKFQRAMDNHVDSETFELYHANFLVTD